MRSPTQYTPHATAVVPSEGVVAASRFGMTVWLASSLTVAYLVAGVSIASSAESELRFMDTEILRQDVARAPAPLPLDMIARARPLAAPGPVSTEFRASRSDSTFGDAPPQARWVNKHDTDESPSVILFAGGTIQLMPPPGWQVWEMPVGREVRLLLTTEPPRSTRSLPQDSVWFSAHARPAGPVAEPHDAITERFAMRLRQLEGPLCRIQPPHNFRFGNFTALRHNFEVVGKPTESQPSPLIRAGFQMVIVTPWAFYEMHAVAPANDVAARSAMWQQLVSSLKIGPPSRQLTPASDAMLDAAPILGSWKAFRSRMRLHPDGHIALHFDAPRGQRIDQPLALAPSGATDSTQPTELHGTFQAQGDLLLVTWADGSQLNFRWRVHGEDLLMTDHNGRISQLRKLLE